MRLDIKELELELDSKIQIIENGKQLLHEREIAFNNSQAQNKLNMLNIEKMKEAIDGFKGDKEQLTSLVNKYSESVQKQADTIGNLNDKKGMLKS